MDDRSAILCETLTVASVVAVVLYVIFGPVN
jgi:hypothetical protein